MDTIKEKKILMLESLFIISIIIGFIFLIKGIDDERIAYAFISILAFLFAAAGSLYIETPGVTTKITDYAAATICFGLIFVNLIFAIAMMMDARRSRKFNL